MEKKDLDLKTKRFKTAERRQNESEHEKELRQESDRLRIAKKRQLTADLNLETKRLAAERKETCLELNRQQTGQSREHRAESKRARTRTIYCSTNRTSR
jgi:hypothetical protein